MPLDFLMQCLRHNRIGDATLYAALHRGKYVYVKLWGWWLYWSGHHWMENIDNLKAFAAVDYVCDEYLCILVESSEAEEGFGLVKAINKRHNLLRDMTAREKLLECTLILSENPMYIEGDELDKQEFLMATPMVW